MGKLAVVVPIDGACLYPNASFVVGPCAQEFGAGGTGAEVGDGPCCDMSCFHLLMSWVISSSIEAVVVADEFTVCITISMCCLMSS